MWHRYAAFLFVALGGGWAHCDVSLLSVPVLSCALYQLLSPCTHTTFCKMAKYPLAYLLFKVSVQGYPCPPRGVSLPPWGVAAGVTPTAGGILAPSAVMLA